MRGAQEKTEKLLQWHQAFYAELQIEFQPYMDEITFVCYHYPRRMIRHLEEKRGLAVSSTGITASVKGGIGE